MIMKKYLAILIMAVFVISSCDEEPLVFDNISGQTLVNFSSSSVDMPVVIDGTGSVDVTINVTTEATSDRTIGVTVVSESTTADPNSYSVGTLVIPAGSFNGVLTITGTDVNVETDAEALVLALDTSSGILTDGNLTVSIFQICPIPTTSFIGNYSITVVTAGVFGASTYGAADVSLSVGANSTQRVFTGDYFEDSRFNREFILNFICNEIVTPYQDQNVGCGGNDVNLSTGPSAAENGVYDGTDDSSFTVIVSDNVDSDCGGGPVQASYIFTKL